MQPTPPLQAGRPSTPANLRPWPKRIWRVSYRSGYNDKLVRVVAKVPYSGIFPLTETLTRALSTGEIRWFRLEPVSPTALTVGIRARLTRWPEALRASSLKTEVTWQS